MIDGADRLSETPMGYGYGIPMPRPSPVQFPLKGTGGVWNLYVLRHFLPDHKISNLEVSPLFSMTYAAD